MIRRVSSSCSGDVSIMFCGIQLAIFGLLELYFGFLVLITSGYHNYGGWYCGFCCFCVSLLTYYQTKSKSSLIFLMVLSIVAMVSSLIAVILQINELRLTTSLKACASYTVSSRQTCVYSHFGFDCYGNEDYFKDARDCLSKFEYIRGATDDDCSCVTKHSSDDCYNYTGMQYCEHYIDKIPSITIVSFSMACLCLVSCFAMIYFVAVALRNLDSSSSSRSYSVVSGSEDDEEQVELTSQQGTSQN